MSDVKCNVNPTRKQMGLLTINKKSYELFEGLNIIGRDLKATVRLKDVQFSKQHAIISIVDETTHFISDYSSSNGTFLAEQRLVPYKFYRLSDKDSITFSNVSAFFKTCSGPTKLHNIEESDSQSNLYDLPTQVFNCDKPSVNSNENANVSQNIHLQATQALFYIHDAPTQEYIPQKSNFNDFLTENDDCIPATQDCNFESQNKQVTGLKLPHDLVSSTQDNLDFSSRVDYYDDVFANETFRLSLINQSENCVIVDETVLPTEKSSVHAGSDTESIDILNTEPVSELMDHITVKKGENCTEISEELRHKNQAEKSTKVVDKTSSNNTDIDTKENKKNTAGSVENYSEVKCQKIITDDSETDLDEDYSDTVDELNIKSQNKNKLYNNSVTDSKTVDKLNTDEDDSTDVELDKENLSKKKYVTRTKRLKLKKQNKVVKTNNEDSDTDMEDNDMKIKQNVPSVPNPTSSDSETDLEHNENIEKLKNAVLTTTNNNTVKKKDKIMDSGSETDIENEDLLKMQHVNSAMSAAKEKNASVQNEKEDNNEETRYSSEEEIDLLAPTENYTQLDESKDCNNLPEEVEANVNAQSVFEDVDDNDLMLPTQLLVLSSINQHNEDRNKLAPTQLGNIKNISSIVNNEESRYSRGDIEDIHGAATQFLEPVTKEEKEDVEYLAPTQLLNPENVSLIIQKSKETQKEFVQPGKKFVFKNKKELLLPIEKTANLIEDKHNEDIYSAPTQLLEQVASTSKITIEDEVDYLAPTQLLNPINEYSNIIKIEGEHEDNKEELCDDLHYLAPTQVLEPVLDSSISKRRSEETDSLPPTQILECVPQSSFSKRGNDDYQFRVPAQILNKGPLFTERKNEDPDSIAPTRILEQPAISKSKSYKNVISSKIFSDNNSDDDDYLAPTQILDPVSSNKNNEDTDYLAPTQPLHFDIPEQNIFLAPAQLIVQSTPKFKQTRKPLQFEENDDDFLAPTQKLSTDKKSPTEQSVSYSEDMFEAETQKLFSNQDTFATPEKQKQDNVIDDCDDDYMAPTQILTAPKSVSSNKDDEYMHLDNSDKNISMKLAISLTDTEFDDSTQKSELPKNSAPKLTPKSSLLQLKQIDDLKNLSEKIAEPETQLEVEFELTTQKLYLEKETLRPNNPIGNIFNDENTQLSDTDSQINAKSFKKIDSDQTASTIDTSDSSINEQNKKRSFEEPFENSNKKFKNSKHVDSSEDTSRRTSRRAESINSKYSRTNAANKKNISTAKGSKKVDKKSGLSTVDKNTNLCIVDESPKTGRIRRGQKIVDKSSEKELNGGSSDEEIFSLNDNIKTGEKIDKEKNANNNKRREIKDGTGKLSTTAKVSEIHSDTNKEVKGRKNTKIGATNYEKVVIDNQEEKELEKNIMNEIDTKKLEPENLRSVQVNLLQLNLSERKKEIKTKPENADNKLFVDKELRSTTLSKTRATRSTSNIKEDKLSGTSNENPSDLQDFATKNKKPRQPSKRQTVKKAHKSIDDEDQEVLTIDDSDDSTNSSIEKYIKKRILKIHCIDESELVSSNCSTTSSILPRHSKRTLKIEDYSSDENKNENANTNSYSTFLETPNTKRRKYEPLNVAINNSQTSNVDVGAIRHKVVFTMINNPDLENGVKTLGGSTVDSVYACTALVTNKISRSLKFLIAVALGKPIVNINWISESLNKKTFLDPWDFLLEDQESEDKFNISLKDSLTRARGKKLLTDYVILLAVNKNFDVLKEIIETSGGKCVTRAPAKNSCGNLVVVAYEEEKAKYSRYLKQKSPLTVVAAEAIFSGILSQKLNLRNHTLS